MDVDAFITVCFESQFAFWRFEKIEIQAHTIHKHYNYSCKQPHEWNKRATDSFADELTLSNKHQKIYTELSPEVKDLILEYVEKAVETPWHFFCW